MKNVAKEIDAQFDSGRRNMDVDEIFKNAGVSNKFNSAYRDNIKGYIKELNEMSKSAPRAKTGIDGVNEALEKQGSAPVKTATNVLESINSGMASIGKTALSIGGNVLLDVALSYGLQKAGEAWDNYSNQQENAIQKGNEALDKYKQTNQEMQAATSWVNDNGERFVELSNKATRLGEQGSLTDAEFKEYNQLSAQASQYFSDQITGYNSLGTAITSVAQSKNSLDSALTTEKLQKYSQAADEAKDVVGKFKAEMYQDKGITKETGITNQMDAINSFLKDYDSGKVKDAFEGASIFNPGLSSAYTQDLNLLDSMRQAGIKATGFAGKDFSFDDFLNEDNIQSLRNYYQDLKTQAADSLSAIKQVMPSFLQEQEAYQKLIDQNPNIDSEMATMLTGMDQSGIERILGGNVTDLSDEEIVKNFRDWSNKLVTNLQDPETQKAFQNLFSIDDDKASLSFQDYEKKATDAVDAVSKKTSAFTKDELKQQSGITDSLDEMQTAYNNIADRFGKDKGFSEDYIKNQLSANDMLTLGSMATDDQYKDLSYNEALERIQNVQDKAKLSLDSMQKVVTTATANLSTLQSATSEASSATGLTADTITSMGGMFSDIDNFDSAALFKNTANGVKLNTKALSSLLAVQHDIKANNFARSIEEQTKAIAEQNDVVQAQTKGTDAYKTEQDKLKSMFADLSALQQAQSQYHALYKQQQELFSDYGQWQQSQSTANAGDKYNNMVSGLQAAKEAWDKGLIGTDDFKSFAKLISPSGATDDVNFAENYAKAARYLTEDESGVKAFLNDLSSKGLADFNEESQQWSYNVKDMAEAAKQMGMGKDFMSNMFGRLEDYGFHNNVISDAEDGVLKLSDAYSNLAESEARLEDLKKNDPTNTTAIEQAEKEVSGYKQDIDELGTNLKEVASHTAENYNRELETAKNQMKTLADERERILKSNEYGDNTQAVADYMQSQIDQLGQSYGLDSSALQQQAEQAAKAYSDALQNATIENPVTPDFGEDTASADAYASAVDKVQQANKDNNQTLSDSIKTLQEYNSEQIKGIDLFDGAYDSDELKPAEQALDNICQSLGLTSEEAGLLGQVLESMGIIKPEVDDSEVKQAKTDAEETKQTYDNLGDSTVSINADVSGEDSVASFVDQCSSIQQGMTTTITATVSGESEVESLESGLEQIPDNTPTTVDVTVNNQQDLDNIQSKVDSLNAGGKDITLNAHIKPDGDSEVEVKAKDTTVKVTPDPKEVEVTAKPVKVDVQPSNEEVNVNAKANITGVVGGDGVQVSLNATANVTTPPTVPDTTVKATAHVDEAPSVPDADGNAHYENDLPTDAGNISGFAHYDTDLPTYAPSITGTVTYYANIVGAPSGGIKATAAGTFGQARAYAQGSLTDLSAYAGGRVSLPRDEKALVNEVGTESIVRDGEWSLIPGGAHLTNLKKGDIIFSASQTEDLLKRGATPGHARAYAQGSLSDISLTHAFDGGSGWGGFGGGLSNKTSVSSGSQQSTNSNTNATNANTAATEENTSAAKDSTETFDWIKPKLEKFAKAVERISNQITDYISSAFKSTLLKRQMSAIDKEITANKQGYDAYMKKAESIGISQDYKNKVANGTFSIEDIDTSTDAGKKLAENIKKYQTYYDAAQDCKDKIQELNNTQLELYETWANMPIEAVEKKIDRIKKKYESLNSFSSAATYGYSTISILTDQINADNPKLKNAASKVTKAENARKETKATRTQAGKNLKSATANAKESGTNLVQSAKAQTSSIAKSLKSAAKSSTSKATYSAITSAIRNGTPVSTKGLKGDALKYAKSYNKSLKQQTSISKSVSSGKSVSTTAISSSLQSEAAQYNKDTKAQKSAQKNYNTAKANDEAAAKRLAAAQKNKDEIYSSTTKEQQTLATNKSSKSYVVQNTLLSQETASLREENKARQKALSQTNANVKAQKKAYDKAVKSRDSAGSKLLSTKSVVSSLNKTQKAAIKSGKIVSTKGISNPAVLKALEDYNKKVRNASTENKKFSIQVKAQTDALNEAAKAEANYAETLVANEQKKFENIKNYYEARLQYRQALAEWSEKSQDLSDAHGNYTTSTSYDSQISNLEKERALQQEEAEKLQSQLDKSVSQGKIKKGSEEWLDMKTQIIEAQNAVKDLDTQIENTKQQQIATRYEEMFDRAIDKADKFIAKLGSIDDLISDDMKYNSDTGELTEFGALSIALNAKELDSQLDNIRTYVKKRQQIMEDFANGTNESKYGEKTYDELMAENDSNMQNAIKNASSYRDAILNIIKSQSQAVQDALFKEMDAYKKAKKKQKEYYDYDKQLKDKNSEIELLDQQIAALEGVTDAESKAMKAKLEAQRKEKQDDLDDTVRDHVYDLQVKGLDDLKDQLSEDFDKWSKELTSNFEKATDVINNAVNSVGNNTATVMETLAKILKLYGVNPDDLLTSNDLGNLDGYASGTKRVGGVPRLAMTNEKGREIIATKKGILTPVEPSDGIINHDMTETLMKMASEYQSFHMPEIQMPDVQIISKEDSSGGDVSIHYDSLLTVQGDVTKDALPDLKTILKQASEYTQNDIRKNRRRFG